jgi:hypothetical protein
MHCKIRYFWIEFRKHRFYAWKRLLGAGFSVFLRAFSLLTPDGSSMSLETYTANLGRTKKHPLRLLTRGAQVRRFAGAEIGAPGIDVQAAAPGVARVHGQLVRLALAQDVGEDALDALLVEFVVLAEADQVFQQAFLVDLRAA